MLTLTNEHKITANGIKITYDDTGLTGTDTTPIIFIHGFPFNRSCWDQQLNYFKQGHRVIAYDVRGFGGSGNGSEKPSIDLFADDLIALMDELKIDKAIVCGISMGGYILLNALERYPERFEAAILADTQSSGDSIEAQDKRHFSIQQIEAGGIGDFAATNVKKVLSQETHAYQKELAEKLKQQIVSTSPKILTSTLNALLQRKDMTHTLKSINVPTLIIGGNEDAVIPTAQSEQLFRNIPNSVLFVIEKAGHLSNIDQPDEFNKQVSKFIKSL